MTRAEFDHVIRAAADIVDDVLVVIGSQAVLGQFPDAPEAMLTSLEVDLFPKNRPERVDEIDRSLGDGSRFHATYGYYAHGVGPETAITPEGWTDRLVPVDVPAPLPSRATVRALCLEVHDLTLAKLAAGRSRDLEWAAEAIRAGLVTIDRLRQLLDSMPERHRTPTRERLEGVIRAVAAGRRSSS